MSLRIRRAKHCNHMALALRQIRSHVLVATTRHRVELRYSSHMVEANVEILIGEISPPPVYDCSTGKKSGKVAGTAPGLNGNVSVNGSLSASAEDGAVRVQSSFASPGGLKAGYNITATAEFADVLMIEGRSDFALLLFTLESTIDGIGWFDAGASLTLNGNDITSSSTVQFPFTHGQPFPLSLKFSGKKISTGGDGCGGNSDISVRIDKVVVCDQHGNEISGCKLRRAPGAPYWK